MSDPFGALATQRFGDTPWFNGSQWDKRVLDHAVFNVLDYGARGDGATDDTAALQRALAAANGAHFRHVGYTAIVYLPPGTYILNGLLDPASFVAIRGASMETTTIKRKAGSTQAQMIRMLATASILSDLTLDGNYPNVGTVAQVDAEIAVGSSSTSNQIQRVQIVNPTHHGIDLGTQDMTRIEDCIFTGNAVAGNSATLVAYGIICASTGTTKLLIAHNTFSNWTNAGTFISGSFQVLGNLYYNNHIQTVASGGGQIAFNGDGAGIISGNLMTNGGGSLTVGIEVDNVTIGTIITSNHINFQSQEGILVQGAASNIIINANIVKNCGGAGGIVSGRPNVTISNNHCFDDQVSKTQPRGVKVASGATNNNVHGNNTIGNITDGVLDSAADTSNSIYGNTPGAWTAFTPALQQNAAAVASTVLSAHYEVTGKFFKAQIELQATAAGTAGNPIYITGLPTPARSSGTTSAGSGIFLDSGTAVYTGTAIFASATQLGMYRSGATVGLIGADPSEALANNDVFSVDLCYEMA